MNRFRAPSRWVGGGILVAIILWIVAPLPVHAACSPLDTTCLRLGMIFDLFAMLAQMVWFLTRSILFLAALLLLIRSYLILVAIPSFGIVASTSLPGLWATIAMVALAATIIWYLIGTVFVAVTIRWRRILNIMLLGMLLFSDLSSIILTTDTIVRGTATTVSAFGYALIDPSLLSAAGRRDTADPASQPVELLFRRPTCLASFETILSPDLPTVLDLAASVAVADEFDIICPANRPPSRPLDLPRAFIAGDPERGIASGFFAAHPDTLPTSEAQADAVTRAGVGVGQMVIALVFSILAVIEQWILFLLTFGTLIFWILLVMALAIDLFPVPTGITPVTVRAALAFALRTSLFLFALTVIVAIINLVAVSFGWGVTLFLGTFASVVGGWLAVGATRATYTSLSSSVLTTTTLVSGIASSIVDATVAPGTADQIRSLPQSLLQRITPSPDHAFDDERDIGDDGDDDDEVLDPNGDRSPPPPRTPLRASSSARPSAPPPEPDAASAPPLPHLAAHGIDPADGGTGLSASTAPRIVDRHTLRRVLQADERRMNDLYLSLSPQTLSDHVDPLIQHWTTWAASVERVLDPYSPPDRIAPSLAEASQALSHMQAVVRRAPPDVQSIVDPMIRRASDITAWCTSAHTDRSVRIVDHVTSMDDASDAPPDAVDHPEPFAAVLDTVTELDATISHMLEMTVPDPSSSPYQAVQATLEKAWRRWVHAARLVLDPSTPADVVLMSLANVDRAGHAVDRVLASPSDLPPALISVATTIQRSMREHTPTLQRIAETRLPPPAVS